MGNLWIDTRGEGYPEVEDFEFGPVFVRENEKRLNELAEIIDKYDFKFYIGSNEEEICVIVRTEMPSEEKGIREEAILQNEKLIEYASSLLELEYIKSIQLASIRDTKVISIDFEGLSVSWFGLEGPWFRRATYVKEEDLDSANFDDSFYDKHIVGNWYHLTWMEV